MRLIDADALYEKLQKYSSYDLDFFDSELREVIETIPTAYDVEKVVEELKELSNAEADYYYAKSNDVIDRENAIEIVKSGGV